MNKEQPTIDVIIATHRPEGIKRVEAMKASELPGVRYIVSWQNHEDAPVPEALLKRPDMEVHRLDVSGVSRNRNNAIDHSRGDVIVIQDDDVTIYPEGLLALQRYYRDHPEVDFVTFRAELIVPKAYPSAETRLHIPFPKGYYGTSIELSFRRRNGLRFCPELGLGAGVYDAGEDEAVLMTAIHRGLDCRFVPITVCEHMHHSTGTKGELTPANLRACGLVIAFLYPWSACLRVPLKAWRIARKGRAPFMHALWLCIKGAVAAPRVRRRNRKYLW